MQIKDQQLSLSLQSQENNYVHYICLLLYNFSSNTEVPTDFI